MNTRRNCLTYIETRIGARRALFLSEATYEEILGYTDITLLLKHLLSTWYEEDISEALRHEQGGEAVEAAVALHLDREFSALMTMARQVPGQGQELQLFMHRWDLVAIKALLRATAFSRPRNRQELCSSPSLPWPKVMQLAEVNDLEALAGQLRAQFPHLCSSFSRLVRAGAESNAALLEILETALDRDYFTEIVRDRPNGPSRRILGEYAAIEIDRINLRIVLSEVVQQCRFSSEANWLPGGRLSRQLLDRMRSSSSLESALLLLEATPYRSIHQVFYQAITQGRLVGIERRFEVMMVERLKRLTWEYPHGGALFMHFAWKKWIESVNLRVLARGIEQRMPSGRIREELIYV